MFLSLSEVILIANLIAKNQNFLFSFCLPYTSYATYLFFELLLGYKDVEDAFVLLN